MRCQYKTNGKPCNGELGELYQNPPGSQRWWSKCVICNRSNRISVLVTVNNTSVGHTSTSGPVSQELVPLRVRIRKDQQIALEEYRNKSEIVRFALDMYLDL